MDVRAAGRSDGRTDDEQHKSSLTDQLLAAEVTNIHATYMVTSPSNMHVLAAEVTNRRATYMVTPPSNMHVLVVEGTCF